MYFLSAGRNWRMKTILSLAKNGTMITAPGWLIYEIFMVQPLGNLTAWERLKSNLRRAKLHHRKRLRHARAFVDVIEPFGQFTFDGQMWQTKMNISNGRCHCNWS